MYCGAATISILMMNRIRERERELRESSMNDETTGLCNRAYFHRVLSTEVERARRSGRELAVVVADVNRFGDINRVFGLDVGDEILGALGAELKEAAKEGHVGTPYEMNVACRVGGEELAVIVPEVALYEEDMAPSRTRAVAIADEFRARTEALRVRGLSVTVSVAVAVFPGDGDTVDALVDAADRALFAASQDGGNRVVAAWTLPDSDATGDQA
jgi:diguanylate cyclase (GGDEF)-like protein